MSHVPEKNLVRYRILMGHYRQLESLANNLKIEDVIDSISCRNMAQKYYDLAQELRIDTDG